MPRGRSTTQIENSEFSRADIGFNPNSGLIERKPLIGIRVKRTGPRRQPDFLLKHHSIDALGAIREGRPVDMRQWGMVGANWRLVRFRLALRLE
jgi:hypothetical protein